MDFEKKIKSWPVDGLGKYTRLHVGFFPAHPPISFEDRWRIGRICTGMEELPVVLIVHVHLMGA